MLEQGSGWLFNSLTQEWQELLTHLRKNIDEIENRINGGNFLPNPERIFAAIDRPISENRVLILGQDPYPNRSDAMGIAFSVPSGTEKLPPTLRNIFRELHDDIGGELRTNGDLTDWQRQGVVLLNQTLTLEEGLSNSHRDIGWNLVTGRIVEHLNQQIDCAILWGKQAQECAPLLGQTEVIVSPHPSPLSSYRGFFGSRPFSRANTVLQSSGHQPINWLGAIAT